MNPVDSVSPSAGRPRALDRASLALRLALIAAALAVLLLAFGFAGGWLTPHALTPTRMIDAFESANGVHAGFRRNHAKGVWRR